MERFAVKGIFVDTPTPDTLRVRDGYMLCEDGRCGAFREAAPAGVPVYDHSGQIITPGFVDLHLHAPQYSYCGTAMDLELLDWLQQYTYPEESHYADADYARAGYGYFVRDLTHSATTRACIFGTLHTDATLELMHQLKAAGLSAFTGAGRRFEVLGKTHTGATVADDYAHHPAELRATLTAAKELDFKRVWAVFQPFTFSRTYMLLDDFVSALSIADRVVLSPIMGSREVNTYHITSEDLGEKIPGCVCLPSFRAMADYVSENAEAGDLILTLGCGDIYKASKMMVADNQ